jgi:hypothetical protein
MHLNTRIAKELHGALTALIERPSYETYQTMIDYIEAFRAGYIEDDEYEELGYDPVDIYSLIDG